MNCSICQRPLFEGASACVVCGAPVAARVDPLARASAPPPAPPDARASAPPHVSAVLTPAAYSYTPPPFHAQPPPQQTQAQATPASPYGAPPAALPYGAPPYNPPSYGAPPSPPAALQPYRYAPPLALAPNHLATASFVCGVFGLVPLWIGFALCILAIIFGVLGIQRAGQLPGERGKGLAIAGLVLGILFILPAGCGL